MTTQIKLRSHYTLLLGWIVCGTLCAGCGTVQFVHGAQPEFIVPPTAQAHTITVQDLSPLKIAEPAVHEKLLKNIRAWRLELKQWRSTAEVYNKGVRYRNSESRKRLME